MLTQILKQGELSYPNQLGGALTFLGASGVIFSILFCYSAASSLAILFAYIRNTGRPGSLKYKGNF